MRVLLRIMAILLVLVAAGWAGAEFMLVRQARKAAEDGRIGLGGASMLADPTRIGGHLAQVVVPLGGGLSTLSLSGVDLWVPPLAWNIPHASLPAQARLSAPWGERVLEFGGGHVEARFSPFRGMALVAAGIDAQAAALDGQPVAGALRIGAHLTNYGAVVPANVQAAYRIDSAVTALNLPLLARMLQIGQPSGERPGATDIDGPVTLWLSNVVSAGGQRPQVVGATFDGLRVRIDGTELRIWGQLARDDSGVINGQLALDSGDLRAFVVGLAHAGYLPLDYAQLAATALETVARDAEASEPAPDAAPISSPNLITQRQAGVASAIPPRPADMARIPLRIEAGQVYLGNLALSALLEQAP